MTTVYSAKMAKFVIAGCAGCPAFARTEMLADTLAASLPDFKVHKIVHPPDEWPSWLQKVCSCNSWNHPSPSSSSSPLVWRELVDRGGKGMYLGGLKEFEQYTHHYYNIAPATDSVAEKKIATENLEMLKTVQLERQTTPKVEPMRICITNATSDTAYHLASLIATGRVGGKHLTVTLQLLDMGDSSEQLEGTAMELKDLASPHLVDVHVTSSVQEALNSVAMVFILDYPHQVNEQMVTSEEQGSALASSAIRYHQYATTLDFYAQKEVKVIISGKYANSGAAIMAKAVTSIPRSSFVACPSLAESQARSILAQKLHLNSSDIRQVAIWGRTHGPVVCDTDHIRVHHFKGAVVGPDSFSLPVNQCVFESEWLGKEFPSLLAARHGGMDGYRSGHCPLSEAVGLVTLAQGWHSGGEGEEWRSMGLVCKGEYGVPEGLVFSVPARQCDNGDGRSVWKVEEGLAINKETQADITHQVQALQDELNTAMAAIEQHTKNSLLPIALSH